MNTNKSKQMKKERGQRVKVLRSHTHLSRRAFGVKHKIPSGTLQYWEDGNFGGLSMEGARKLARAFAREGIWVDPLWLMEGKGREPILSSTQPEESKHSLIEDLLVREANNSFDTIVQELKFFLRLHALAVHEVVPDENMMPRFTIGEYVAGIQKFSDEINSLIDKDCIIKLKNNKSYIRRLTSCQNKREFLLVPSNPKNKEDLIIVNKNDILSAAAIIWSRRQEY